MSPLGLGIVGTGNIAGQYATDSRTYPELELVAATDLDTSRAAAFARAHGIRAHGSLDDLLADDDVDIVVNLTVHHAHYEVTRRALQHGRHVYSEKPLALRPEEARELVDLARQQGLRLGGSPSTFLGEAQQTAMAIVRSGRLGRVRAVYADASWGPIEQWHPAPAPFFAVGPMVDVGVYALSLATATLGPARSVGAWGWDLRPERVTVAGEPFRIGSPDLIVAALELEDGTAVRVTASFYAGRPARFAGGIEFHGDDGSLALASMQDFDAPVEVGTAGGIYEPVSHARPAYRGTAWARGVAEMAEAIVAGRPHRASGEQAAHIVDILGAISASTSASGRRVPVTSTFEPPPLMPWAEQDAERLAESDPT